MQIVTCLNFSPTREKHPSVNDEDSRSCPAALVTSSAMPVPAAATPGDGAAGASSPPYAVTPIDHDYVKRKRQQQRHRQGRELQQQDGTVPGPE